MDWDMAIHANWQDHKLTVEEAADFILLTSNIRSIVVVIRSDVDNWKFYYSLKNYGYIDNKCEYKNSII